MTAPTSRRASRPHVRISLELMNERRRQIEQLGFGPDHDDQYLYGELKRAAAALIMKSAAIAARRGRPGYSDHYAIQAATLNPFPGSDLVSKQTDARRALVEAGGMVIAAIEQIDRAVARHTEGGVEPVGQPDGAPATQPFPFSIGLSGPAFNLTTELRFTQPDTGVTAVVAVGTGSLEAEYLAFAQIQQILNDHWTDKRYSTHEVVIGDYALLVSEARP